MLCRVDSAVFRAWERYTDEKRRAKESEGSDAMAMAMAMAMCLHGLRDRSQCSRQCGPLVERMQRNGEMRGSMSVHHVSSVCS